MTFTIAKILSNHDSNYLYESVMKKNSEYWRRFSQADFIKWLENFSNEEEMYYALLLANKILYYPPKEIKYLWNLILTNKVKQFVYQTLISEGKPVYLSEKWFQEFILTKCIFIGYGDAQKSGPSMVYLFDKSHSLKAKYVEEYKFLHTEEFLHCDYVFLLDDFIGTGNQAVRHWNKKNDNVSYADIFKQKPSLKFVYLALVGLNVGKEKIEGKTPVNVIIGDELDERSHVFLIIQKFLKIQRSEKRPKRLWRKKVCYL